MDYAGKYIGEKQIKEVVKSGEKFFPAVEPFSVEYMDGTKEIYSPFLIEYVISDEPCDVSELRDKRLQPIVKQVLTVIRDWGLKLNELSPLSILLNQSIDFNHAQALNFLWGKYMAKPLSPENVDMLTIDKVLRDAENAGDKRNAGDKTT